MKINDIITEAGVKPYEKQVINTDKVETILRQFCPAYDNLLVSPIWRGVKNHDEPILKIDPSTGVRQSQNTTNYYTELMDHNPHYNGWPKRSRSLICTTDFKRAVNYSDSGRDSVYAVFPGRGAKVAVCPGMDIWETEAIIPFFGGYTSFPDINYYLQELGLPPVYEEMLSAVKSSWFKKNLIRWCTEQFKSEAPDPALFLPIIMEGMSPNNTHSRLLSVEEYANSGIQGRELWIGDPVIIVKASIIDSLKYLR